MVAAARLSLLVRRRPTPWLENIFPFPSCSEPGAFLFPKKVIAKVANKPAGFLPSRVFMG